VRYRVRSLTVSALRLNGRDYLRDRSTTHIMGNTFNLSSIRTEPPSEGLGSKARQPSVSINVHNSTTADFGRNQSDHDVEPIRKPVCSKHLLATPRLIDVFCCRIQVPSLFKGWVDRRNEARSFSLLARSWRSSESGRGSSTLDATFTR
jgi:hypothetical protein